MTESDARSVRARVGMAGIRRSVVEGRVSDHHASLVAAGLLSNQASY